MVYKICKDCKTEKYPEDLEEWLCIDCLWERADEETRYLEWFYDNIEE